QASRIVNCSGTSTSSPSTRISTIRSCPFSRAALILLYQQSSDIRPFGPVPSSCLYPMIPPSPTPPEPSDTVPCAGTARHVGTKRLHLWDSAPEVVKGWRWILQTCARPSDWWQSNRGRLGRQGEGPRSSATPHRMPGGPQGPALPYR